MRRLGLLHRAPDYAQITDSLIARDLYADVAQAEGIPVPDNDMSPSTVALDDARFDPSAPEQEAARI